MVIFLCKDSFEGILCGVDDAWMSRLGHENVKLELQEGYNLELFAEYRETEGSGEKAQKVLDVVVRKISREAYRLIYHASLSWERGKADAIYRFLIDGFRLGSRVADCLQLPSVSEIFRLDRSVANEDHLLREFLRFSQVGEHELFSVIGPKNDVLTLLVPHFVDRMPTESFIIYDKNRKKAVVSEASGDWFLLSGAAAARLEELAERTDRGEYAALWKTFFDSIAVRERENYRCQRGHLPLRFRSYMTEFQKGI